MQILAAVALTEAVGDAFTVSAVLADAVHAPFDTTTVYPEEDVGVTTIEEEVAPVLQE